LPEPDPYEAEGECRYIVEEDEGEMGEASTWVVLDQDAADDEDSHFTVCVCPTRALALMVALALEALGDDEEEGEDGDN
jgi:hypothetical protein